MFSRSERLIRSMEIIGGNFGYEYPTVVILFYKQCFAENCLI